MRTNLKLYAYTMNGFRLLDFQNNEVKWRTRKVKELFVFLWNDRERQVHKTKIIEETMAGSRDNKSNHPPSYNSLSIT